MSEIVAGRIRPLESYKYSGNRRSDKNAYNVSEDVEMCSFSYTKGLFLFRLKDKEKAKVIADNIKDICEDKREITQQVLRDSIYVATGNDIGSFELQDLKTILNDTDMFYKQRRYLKDTKLQVGDILVSNKYMLVIISIDEEPVEEIVVEQKQELKIPYTIGKHYKVNTDLQFHTEPSKSSGIKGNVCKEAVVVCRQIKKNEDGVWINNGTGWLQGVTSGGKVYIG